MERMLISVLDHSMVVDGQEPAAAIRDSLALARHCDGLGFHRYWVSEHHSSDAIAGTAPEVLLAAIAATTTHMRVGSGGVMLPHYNALKVAEQFRVLEALAPGRVDLGIGRAPGSDPITAMALNPHANQSGRDEFPGQVRDLLAWLDGTPLAPAHPFRAIKAQPRGAGSPQVWILGSSEYGAQLAAYFGLPYCYAHFFSGGASADGRAIRALELYREGFRPGVHLQTPHAAIAVVGLAADSQLAAAWELGATLLSGLWRERGVYAPLPSPETAAQHVYEAAEQAWVDKRRQAIVHGTGSEVAARLTALGDRLGADEMLLVSNAHDPAVRRRSFTLMAEGFGLERSAAQGKPARLAEAAMHERTRLMM